jgi:diguanylate cyclase (GGDEF)-like protein
MIILALSWVGSAAAWTLVVLIDIDHFKSVNDRFGHGVGDRALVALAARVTLVPRDVDMLGRWGGEEFVVVLPETDYLQTLEKACALCTHVAAAPLVDDLAISISCGVANVVADDHAESLLRARTRRFMRPSATAATGRKGYALGCPARCVG